MVWLVGLILLLLPSYLVRFSIVGIPMTVLEVLIYLATVWIFISNPIVLLIERTRPVVKRYGLPVGLFVTSGILATVIAPDKREALGLLKGYILDPLLLFFILVNTTQTKQTLEKLLLALIGSGLLVAIVALVGPTNIEGRALGIYALDATSSPNFLALFLAPLTSLTLAFTFYSKDNRVKVASGISFALMLIALVMSGSRGGLLATGLGVGLVILWQLLKRIEGKARSFIVGASFGFLILVLMASWFIAKPDFSDQPSHRAATSNNLRYEIWRSTIVDILPRTYLLGTGLGNFQPYFTEITKQRVNFPEYISPWARSPHNIFLTIWVNLGLLGLVGFLWLLIQFFIDIFRKKPGAVLGQMLALTMVTLLVHGLVDAAYWKNDLAALFWILVALGAGSRQLEVRDGKH